MTDFKYSVAFVPEGHGMNEIKRAVAGTRGYGEIMPGINEPFTLERCMCIFGDGAFTVYSDNEVPQYIIGIVKDIGLIPLDEWLKQSKATEYNADKCNRRS